MKTINSARATGDAVKFSPKKAVDRIADARVICEILTGVISAAVFHEVEKYIKAYKKSGDKYMPGEFVKAYFDKRAAEYMEESD